MANSCQLYVQYLSNHPYLYLFLTRQFSKYTKLYLLRYCHLNMSEYYVVVIIVSLLYIAVLCTSMQLKKIVESGIVVACVSQMIFDETYF